MRCRSLSEGSISSFGDLATGRCYRLRVSDGWIELDGVAEDALPSWAKDGRTGDRVAFLEAGLLVVEGGLATVARWSDVVSVVSHAGCVYVLVPRRPPHPPWIAVDGALVPDGVDAFLRRLEERRRSGGYRDAIRAQRQDLPLDELRRRVSAREAVPGALEVPSTIVLGRSYPGLGLAQFGSIAGASMAGLFASVALAVVADAPELAGLCTYAGLFLGIFGGALLARYVGQRWRAAKDATLPRQRVLVLAPDGCIIGFRTGVQTLRWADVGRFEAARAQSSLELGLVVRGPEGGVLGEIDAAWLDAPLLLVVAVAEAYRDAAR